MNEKEAQEITDKSYPFIKEKRDIVNNFLKEIMNETQQLDLKEEEKILVHTYIMAEITAKILSTTYLAHKKMNIPQENMYLKMVKEFLEDVPELEKQLDKFLQEEKEDQNGIS